MALILSPEPMPVEVTAAVDVVGVPAVLAGAAAGVVAVDAAPDIVELMWLPVLSQMADLSA
jgi:hypothetical protein